MVTIRVPPRLVVRTIDSLFHSFFSLIPDLLHLSCFHFRPLLRPRLLLYAAFGLLLLLQRIVSRMLRYGYVPVRLSPLGALPRTPDSQVSTRTVR